MKKITLICILGIFVLGSLFAQTDIKIGIGGGGYFTSDFGGGFEASVTGYGKIGAAETPYAGGGGFIFLDVTFAELSLGIFSAGGTWEEKEYVTPLRAEYKVSGTGLDIGLLLKYPFVLSEKLILFPLAGITYRSILSAKLEGEEADNPEDLNALWFKFGGGIDYSFNANVFLRFSFLYGFRTENEYEKDMAAILKAMAPGYVKTENIPGHGLELKLAVGYKF